MDNIHWICEIYASFKPQILVTDIVFTILGAQYYENMHLKWKMVISFCGFKAIYLNKLLFCGFYFYIEMSRYHDVPERNIAN